MADGSHCRRGRGRSAPSALAVHVIDASVWVASLVESDMYHRASMEWLAGQVDQSATIVSPVLALSEIAGAVARRTSQESLGMRATEMVLRLPNIRLVPLDLRLSRLAADIAARLRVRGADAVYVGLARALNIPLVTWDREQMERARPEIDVIAPDGPP